MTNTLRLDASVAESPTHGARTARVLIYSLVFPPDGVSTAQLMGELADDLAQAGHDVSVITTCPHYNRDQVARSSQPLRRRLRGLVYESVFRGIPVLHAAMPADRSFVGRRLWGWLAFHVIGLAAALVRKPAPDVVIVPSPLLTAGLVAWVMTRIRGGAYLYNVQELYPDLAIEMRRIRNPLVIGMLRRLERFVYRNAGAVTGISHEICARVAERGAGRADVHMIPNFVDTGELQPVPRDNPFAREWDLTRDFVVSYAGNMGYAQGLATVLDAARLYGAGGRARYVLIGDGVLRRRITERLMDEGLDNVTWIEHQPYARIPEIYGASDVCLVPLLGEVSASALPSKVFRIMACGRPVLALCDPDSELGHLIRASGAGVVVEPGRADLLAHAVRDLAGSPERRREMGTAGRAFVERYYSRGVVTQRYVDLVSELAARAVRAR